MPAARLVSPSACWQVHGRGAKQDPDAKLAQPPHALPASRQASGLFRIGATRELPRFAARAVRSWRQTERQRLREARHSLAAIPADPRCLRSLPAKRRCGLRCIWWPSGDSDPRRDPEAVAAPAGQPWNPPRPPGQLSRPKLACLRCQAGDLKASRRTPAWSAAVARQPQTNRILRHPRRSLPCRDGISPTEKTRKSPRKADAGPRYGRPLRKARKPQS